MAEHREWIKDEIYENCIWQMVPANNNMQSHENPN